MLFLRCEVADNVNELLDGEVVNEVWGHDGGCGSLD